ncbi:glycosyltransferase [Variovorax sp. LG9.2]|uniref:glycosyltransferase n=1 Tax=Variovorax sp. LG9.2 TaxID=3048626 RepID=UPI002B23043A|nr:glycosyltransferase [Variovorax sp. LG9.2]MEB0056719.1 glycosyltransferase [Variovorax sp. LG9.2]
MIKQGLVRSPSRRWLDVDADLLHPIIAGWLPQDWCSVNANLDPQRRARRLFSQDDERMKILVEHIVQEPYTGKITGGSERSAYLAVDALRLAGHQVDLVVPADSVKGDHIRSPVLSGRRGRLNMRLWYQFLAKVGANYDVILLNHPLDSPTAFRMPPDILRRCTYVNHNGSPWYVSAQAGMRLLGHLKLLRHLGGKAMYLSEQNHFKLQRQWAKVGPQSYSTSRFGEAGKRVVGNANYLAVDMFDDRLDEAICPPNIAAPRKSGVCVVSVGRPGGEKRLPLASRMARKLELSHFVFTTKSEGGQAEQVQKVRALGSEVFVDASHDEIMEVPAGADALILSSRKETYCHVAMEAMAHGVPVMAMEVPPALQSFKELILEWGSRFETTSLNDRQRIQSLVREKYSLERLGHRLSTALMNRNIRIS